MNEFLTIIFFHHKSYKRFSFDFKSNIKSVLINIVILYILDGFYIGGIETQAYEIIKNYPKGNYTFLLNTDLNIRSIEDRFIGLKNYNKIQKIKNISSSHPLFLIIRIVFFKRNKINSIIIYPSNKKMLFVVIGAKFAGIRNIFMSLQNTLYGKKGSTIIKIKFMFYLFNKLGVFLFIVKSYIAFIFKIDIILSNFQVIFNSCDFDDINLISRRFKNSCLKKKTKNVLMVSRLDSIKDQETLLKSFSRLQEPFWKLKIVGDGPKMNSLKKLARGLSLNEKKLFYGESHNIPLILGEADIFAFSTTEAEGFGKVLIEAMAAKVPIISSDVSACRETLFNGKGGVFIPPKDINEWSLQLKELIQSNSLEEISENASFKIFFNSKNTC